MNDLQIFKKIVDKLIEFDMQYPEYKIELKTIHKHSQGYELDVIINKPNEYSPFKFNIGREALSDPLFPLVPEILRYIQAISN